MTNFRVLQSTYPFPQSCILHTNIKPTTTSFISTFTLTYRKISTSAPFNYKNTTISGRKKGRIKARCELNTIGDDKGTADTSSPNNKARAALEQLDSQLSALAEKSISKDRNDDYILSDKEKAFKEAGIGKVDWPEFSPGFLAFTGIGLLLITLVNNILFNTFIASPTSKKGSASYVFDTPKSRFGYEVESPEAPPLTNGS